jgi:hypothetical protein
MTLVGIDGGKGYAVAVVIRGLAGVGRSSVLANASEADRRIQRLLPLRWVRIQSPLIARRVRSRVVTGSYRVSDTRVDEGLLGRGHLVPDAMRLNSVSA